jgi:hypothetical protein
MKPAGNAGLVVDNLLLLCFSGIPVSDMTISPVVSLFKIILVNTMVS